MIQPFEADETELIYFLTTPLYLLLDCNFKEFILLSNSFLKHQKNDYIIKSSFGGFLIQTRDNNDLKELLLDTKNAKLQHYVYKMSPVELLDLMRVRKELNDK